MSQYKPYPAYKDSGAEWLGEVPEHWQVLPCRSVVEEKTQKNDEGRIQEYLSLMANVGVIPYEEKGDVGNKKPEDLSKCKVVSKGNLVINSMNYGIGSFGLSGYNGVCSPVYIVLQPKRSVVEERFALRIFENKEFQRHAQSFGTGILEHRAAIGWDDLKGIHVGIPPLTEQATILSMLDRETTRIDALIEKKTRFIELLREKRQALITHAVTKGLNPNAKMKDSGVEWLGEVPEHWSVKPLGYFTEYISYGFTNPMPTADEGPHMLTANDVGYGEVFYDQARRTSEAAFCELLTDKSRPRRGDVLITKDGTLGRVAIHDGRRACINQSVALLRVNHSLLLPDFVALALTGHGYQERMILEAGGSTIKHIYITRLIKMSLCVPPMQEQRQIQEVIGDISGKLGLLISKTSTSIDLLKERRSALITAAVTGQIDLREAS